MTLNEGESNFVTVKEAAKLFNKAPHNITYLIDYHDSINKYDEFGIIIEKLLKPS